MNTVSEMDRNRLVRLAGAVVDQEKARIIVPPKKNQKGFWFGSGGLVEDDEGRLYVSGRYRNAGDSRTGLAAGERGLELAVFRSGDGGESFEKILSFSKADLSHDGHEVISIEGSALRRTQDGIELYISTEKSGYRYPEGLEQFMKDGTGTWSIDVISASSPETLDPAGIRTVLRCEDPRFLHVKDPVMVDTPAGSFLLFCTHPFNWASSNSGIARLGADGPESPDYTFFPRGYTWDVGISRITGVTPVPAVGSFAGREDFSLVFYDGGESMRNLDEHKQSVKRPRGYSCEELGGLAFSTSAALSGIQRLSVNLPAFVSPMGTGSSRYIQVFHTSHGLIALWQQSQDDGSQPLVMNRVSMDEVEELLS